MFRPIQGPARRLPSLRVQPQPTDILGWILLSIRGCRENGRLFSSILGRLRLGASPPLVVMAKSVSRYCQMFPRGLSWNHRQTKVLFVAPVWFPAWLCCHPATRRGSGLLWWPACCPHTPAEACVPGCSWALSLAGSLAWGSGGLDGKWFSCSLVGDPESVPFNFSET